MLHAFALDMPEWSIHALLRIYKLAEDNRSAIVMFNDRMDEYEALNRQLEYDFWGGHFPVEEDNLERALQRSRAAFKRYTGNHLPVKNRTITAPMVMVHNI